jgi:hypothetical protein
LNVGLPDVGATSPAKTTVIALESSAADNGHGLKMSPPAAAIKITPNRVIARVSQRITVFETIFLSPPLYGWQSDDRRIFLPDCGCRHNRPRCVKRDYQASPDALNRSHTTSASKAYLFRQPFAIGC